MFSFIKKYTETLHGVDWCGDIALVIFVAIFVAMLYTALRADKTYIDELEQIPFK
ncbi:MAG: hypothetical protein U0T84_13345 [Chitinophagales bacterium]